MHFALSGEPQVCWSKCMWGELALSFIWSLKDEWLRETHLHFMTAFFFVCLFFRRVL